MEEALILELKNGKTFGGRLEYYCDEEGSLELYSCMVLDKKNHRCGRNNAKIRNGDGVFSLSEIRNILILPEELRETIRELEDFLKIYDDQYYKAPKGIRCTWVLRTQSHHPDCDFRLHEALAFMRTRTPVRKPRPRSKEDSADLELELENSFDYIRRRLIAYGAKIP